MAMTLEELQVLITAETKDLRRELKTVKSELNGAHKEVQKATSGISNTMKKLGVLVAGAFAVTKIVQFGKASITAASQLEGAMLGLRSILEGQGRSFDQANQFIQSYINDGLVPLQDAVSAYKNLAARGYNDEQIQNVMERLKDAASFGRQSSYTLGAAVASATEGLKNENSVLVDNAGVTKNVAKMWDEYARSIGKNAQQLTQQEKIQAEVNGIMAETRFQVGDAAKYADTYAGKMAALSKTMQDVRVNIGQALMPIMSTVIPILQTLAAHLSRVTALAAQFSQALFGSNKKAAQSAKQATVAQTGVADAVKKAGKEAKGALAGFDEINQLAQSAAGNADEISIGSDEGGFDPLSTNGAIGEGATVSPDVEAAVSRVKGLFRGIWEDLKSLGELPVFQEIGRTAVQLKDEFLKPVADYVIGDFVPSIISSFTDSFAPVFRDVAIWTVEEFAKTFQNVTGTVSGLWDSTWLPSLKKVKDAYLEYFPAMAGAVQSLLDGTIKPFVDYFYNDFVLPIGKALTETIVPILTDVFVWAMGETVKSFTWGANMMNDIYKSVIRPVFDLIKLIVLDTLQIVTNLWDKYGKTLL